MMVACGGVVKVVLSAEMKGANILKQTIQTKSRQ